MNAANLIAFPAGDASAPPLTRESSELLSAAELLLKVQQILDDVACGKFNHQQRERLREWGSGAAGLSAALRRMAEAGGRR